MRLKEKNLLKKFAATLKKFSAQVAKKVEYGKIEFFSFQNNRKNLDPSYKLDLGLWDYLGRVRLVLQQNFIGLI